MSEETYTLEEVAKIATVMGATQCFARWANYYFLDSENYEIVSYSRTRKTAVFSGVMENKIRWHKDLLQHPRNDIEIRQLEDLLRGTSS
jgi:hypothetical protein